jgi:CMP/dCMP kinase
VSFVVTIDGPAAAGKSTTARELARRLGFVYLDTGALYRALALKFLRGGSNPDDGAAVDRVLAETTLDLSGSPDQPHVWLDGRDVGGEIRTPAVSELSSRLAALPVVRRRLVDIQRALRAHAPLVAEGRDVGTVVFPDADVKIYLDAEPEARARRRAGELAPTDGPVALQHVQDELERRDARDRTRLDSPLRPAPGAVVLDTTHRDLAAVLQELLGVVRAHPRFPREVEHR